MQKSNYFRAVKHTIIYGLGRFGSQLVGLLLVPIYTAHLVPADYGVLAIINSTGALVAIVLQVGLSTAIFKNYYHSETPEARKLLVSTAFLWTLGLGTLALLMAWWSAPFLSGLLLGKAQYSTFLRLMFINQTLTLLGVIPYSIFRAQEKSTTFAFLSLVDLVSTALLSIYLVAVAEQGVYGVLLANAITGGLFPLIGLFLIRKEIGFKASFPILKDLLKFGAPLILSGLGSYILVQSDRYFLRHFSTLSEVGLYSMGYNIGIIINGLIVQPFQLAWVPLAFEIQHKEDARRFFESMLSYLFMILSWLALGLSLFAKEVVAIMAAPAYQQAYSVVPWISFAYVFYGGYMVVNIGMYLKNKTKYIARITLCAAALNITLNMGLIPSLGRFGAALATVLSYIFLFGIALAVNRRLIKLSYEWGRIIKLVIVTFILLILGSYIQGELLISVILKTCLMIGYWLILILLGFFTKQEKDFIKTMVHKIFTRLAIWRKNNAA